MSFFSKIFGERGWERFPNSFVSSIKKTLGAEQFESLTVLAEKYKLFDQALFEHSESFTDIHNELTNIKVVGFLTSVGNELSRRNITDDAEKAFRIALSLSPEHGAARAGLAVLCYSTGRPSEAKEHARRAIVDMDIFTERYKDIDVPEDIADPQDISLLHAVLRSIVGENTLDSENILVLSSKIAQIFANDESFVCEIGLDEIPPHLRAGQLEPRIGFIIAQYRTLKWIFKNKPQLCLDDKLMEQIYSRISLIPEVAEDHGDVYKYARQCYIDAQRNASEMGKDWNVMSLKEKFFEVCLRTEIEEEKLIGGQLIERYPSMEMAHRDIFSLLFEKTFEYVDWEIDDEDMYRE